MSRTKHVLNWRVGPSANLETKPEIFVPAVVPGAVQLDWARAHDWPALNMGDNFREYDGLEDKYWTYITELPALDLAAEQRLFFVCLGVDYEFQIRLSGEVLHTQTGMFSPVELDLTGKSGVLEVVVSPAPKSGPMNPKTPRDQANQSAKPAVSYGWDFHPRLIPLGIWDETYLEIRSATHIQNAETFYELNGDFSLANVRLEANLSASTRAKWSLIAPSGETILSVEGKGQTLELCGEVENPALWWPNGQGEAALYTSRLVLENGDAHESRIGFRRVRLVMNEGAWQKPKAFPISRSTPPIQLEVNGRKIFGKGSNFVPPHIFFGAITDELYSDLLSLAQGAHFNLIRVWGGGILNKAAFWRECDERGLMVWQEFPLACNYYEGTPEYLAVLDVESKSMIRHTRQHPSLAMWCGGNELFNAWSGMTEQDLPMRLLARNCFDLDPTRPFLMTSPLMGMGHGNYLFREPSGREAFQMFVGEENTAYTEFGCSHVSNLEVLREIIPENEMFPPKRGTSWQTHHAFDGWDMDGDTWLMLHLLNEYGRNPQTLEELVEVGQWLGCEGYKALFEEARRQKPRCSMALNWCFNEPWPTAANNSIVNWPARPKPSLKAVSDSCRPVLVSARIPKFSWQNGETIEIDLFLLNDAPEETGAFEVRAFIDDQEFGSWSATGSAANENLEGPKLQAVVPHGDGMRFRLRLEVVGRSEWNSGYELCRLA